MASVLPIQRVAGLARLDVPAVPVEGGFKLSDVGPAAPGGIRYVAQSDAAGVAVIGSKEGLVRELALGLVSCK
jgi:hypothetical protein